MPSVEETTTTIAPEIDETDEIERRNAEKRTRERRILLLEETPNMIVASDHQPLLSVGLKNDRVLKLRAQKSNKPKMAVNDTAALSQDDKSIVVSSRILMDDEGKSNEA